MSDLMRPNDSGSPSSLLYEISREVSDLRYQKDSGRSIS